MKRILIVGLFAISGVQAESLHLLDGSILDGAITKRDAYTLSIAWGSVVASVPIASLAWPDLTKYSEGTDWNQDPRFWYERREAIQEIEKKGPLSPALTQEQGDVFRRLDLAREYAWQQKLSNKAATEGRLAAIDAVWKHREEVDRASAGATILRNRKKIVRLDHSISELESAAEILRGKIQKMRQGGPNESLAQIQLSSLARDLANTQQERADIEAANANLMERWSFSESELNP